MFQERKASPEVQVHPQVSRERRRFSAEYKRRMILEAEKCGSGQLGSLLRREALTYTQLSEWRKAYAEGRLRDKRRGPQANPNLADVRRLEAENARLKRKLEQADAIIDAQKKLAQLLDNQKEEPS
jgi:transposase-like protein